MRFFSAFVLSISLLLLSAGSFAQANEGAVYSRNREGNRRGYSGDHYGRGYRGYGFYGYQPIVTGSWYARPYPHHFDYYRWRYSTPPRAVDCPCAAATFEQ